jgi:hypothetical protein
MKFGTPAKTSYDTDIRLGERYIDKQTGIQGTATAVTFFQHGCERVSIETVVNGEIKDYGFDSPRLTHVETQKQATTTRTGGPERGVSGRRQGPVAR